MYKVFIDGAHGTTGLRINEYLAGRPDIQIIEIDPEKRKDTEARINMIKEADVSILCLPDQASREIAAAAPADSVIIDTSTAHRTDPEWTYGMPELTADQRDRIRSSTRIANPGCHASGFILLVRSCDGNTASLFLWSIIDLIVSDWLIDIRRKSLCENSSNSSRQSGFTVVNVTHGTDIDMWLATVKICHSLLFLLIIFLKFLSTNINQPKKSICVYNILFRIRCKVKMLDFTDYETMVKYEV